LVLTAIETGLALLVQNTAGTEAAAQHHSDYDDGCHDAKHDAQQQWQAATMTQGNTRNEQREMSHDTCSSSQQATPLQNRNSLF
jgi:hypothetical protein